MSEQKIRVDYFTDILCIWAHAAQKRLDEIKLQYGDQIELHLHFFSVFGAVDKMMLKNWGEEGVAGYNLHVHKVAKQFDYLDMHRDVWLGDTPKSSLSIHIFLKAVQLLIEQEKVESAQFDAFLWATRQAFFKDAENIGRRGILYDLASELGFDVKAIQVNIDSGAAHAALEEDHSLAAENQITISPTYLLNESRQKLVGNVGYRIIEANLQGLLIEPGELGASWC
ncbi:MAG: disulfide bond formation protein DsbA [Methylococcales bacterium]|jgi:predicted DsbA family dithiol-disulfide isomerase|nr:disulfide bond formation protein DsbA [Methylococcales bacterium]MBT7444713.1 disulfide bond formation protein DsbA [Methylococcales bacterium]